MPRPLRVEYEGALYHVVNRGDRGERIYLDDEDGEIFLRTLASACEKTGWQVHAYCLLGNHFHLVIETPQANLVAGMKWFLGSYTARFNRRHKLSGHLFAGRYKSLAVDGSSHHYLQMICDYVHLNPVRAKLIDPDQPLREYGRSSFVEYLRKPGRRPAWLRVDRLFGAMGITRDTPAGRQEFERLMESRRREAADMDWKVVRRGWCLGDEGFRKKLLAQLQAGSRAVLTGPPRREAAAQQAERLLHEELSRLQLTEADLARLPKGDPRKVAIGQRLRRETTVTLKWIAHRLKMGVWTYAATCLYSTPDRKNPKRTKGPGATAPRSNPRRRGAEASPNLEPEQTSMEELPTHCL